MKAKIKAYYDENRCNLSERIPLDTPLTLMIQPATVCNLKCKYCIQSVSKIDKEKKFINNKLLSMDDFLEILNQAKKFPDKIKDVSFTGMGEPLLNKELPKMIKLMNESGIAERTQFFTNGLLLDKKTSLELIDAGLSELRISLQGLTADKYFEISGVRINYDTLIANIKFFYENKKQCKLYIKIADISINGQEEEFYRKFGDICDSIYIENIVPLFEDINYDNMLKNSSSVVNKYNEKYINYNVCPNCFYTLNITPEGDVLPCCGTYRPELGNVKKNSLVEIWNGEKRKQFLYKQLNNARFKDINCKDCYVPNNQQPEDNLDNCSEEVIKKFL